MGFWSGYVAGADRDERHDPSERQGNRTRRIGERRGYEYGEPQRRPVRSGNQPLQVRPSKPLFPFLSPGFPSASRRQGPPDLPESGPGEILTAYRNLQPFFFV